MAGRLPAGPKSPLPTPWYAFAWRTCRAPPYGRSRSWSRVVMTFRWAGTPSASSTERVFRCIAACRRRVEPLETMRLPLTRRRAWRRASPVWTKLWMAATSSAVPRSGPAFPAWGRAWWAYSSSRKEHVAASGASCWRSTSRCHRCFAMRRVSGSTCRRGRMRGCCAWSTTRPKRLRSIGTSTRSNKSSTPSNRSGC